MNRRGFLSSILVAAAAPAIVRADSLMRIVPMEPCVLPLSGPLIYDAPFKVNTLARNLGDTIVVRMPDFDVLAWAEAIRSGDLSIPTLTWRDERFTLVDFEKRFGRQR